jgi:hypothetical protein
MTGFPAASRNFLLLTAATFWETLSDFNYEKGRNLFIIVTEFLAVAVPDYNVFFFNINL